MSQKNYDEQGVAISGLKYALIKDERILDYAAEVRLPFGRFTALGTDKELQVILPVLATDITALKSKRGVVVHSHSVENIQDGLEPGYPAKYPSPIMTRGLIYVEVETDVTPTSDVYVRHAVDGGLDQLGIFAPATGSGLALLADARWHKSSVETAGKKIAVLELL